MTTASLIQLGRERGVTIGERLASRLLEHDGPRAGELLQGAAALTDLAGALGHDLELVDALGALRFVDGDYDAAHRQLLHNYRLADRRAQVFRAEWSRLERKLYSDDARARHAVFAGRLAGGTLGHQASLLLRAAEDAKLKEPTAATFRKRLEAIVADGIERAYPIRREQLWKVVGEGGEEHARRLEASIRDEQRARDMVLARRPELAQRIDALSDFALKGDVRRCLSQIRRALQARVEHGWIADPERYEREVIATARDAALRAS